VSDRIGKIVIVGGGHAGGRTAEWLRSLGYDGALTIIGAELCPPYERPPLSKGLLTGEKAFADCRLHPEVFYRDNDIEFIPGHTATALDIPGKRLTLADGGNIPYDRLVLATGAHPKTLNVPGAGLPGVHLLRDEGQAAAIAKALRPGAQIAVIGGGFIGLEVAAAAKIRGADVTVIEAAGRLLGRSLPAVVAEDVAHLHRSRGVEIITEARISAMIGSTRIEAVELHDGRRIEATAVVIGIGIRPATELAQAAGIACDDGILADADCATAMPGIYAVGDAARCFNDHYGRHIRLESWQNAEQQAEICARALLGEECRWRTVPWICA
jgi:3-phenylpropionate/trans-cinnamate dioxygenase ferredoxin reductase subunit